MLNSDEHLERALAEYNDKVSALEDSGPREKLLEALVNRGCVLFMMDSYVSAYGDFDDASDIIAEIEDSGGSVDPGLYVKTHAMKGMTIVEKSVHEAAEEFRLAATRLGQLKPGARHFPDGRAIADFCLDCAQTLIDEDMGADALPFTEKSMSQTVGKDDAWSRNRYMEACSMEADALSGSEDPEKAGEYFDEAVRTGESLRPPGSWRTTSCWSTPTSAARSSARGRSSSGMRRRPRGSSRTSRPAMPWRTGTCCRSCAGRSPRRTWVCTR
ncbi:hypothetical protein AUQ37_01725 [Candidatus Methanomethylophilus sp. 1R26]|uniref:hypothetical protein n=1 Tax=Candidatus Methanomethylophilus sp. 1R26 TaxID=1769296 RepID=UPI0007361D61|nr:hypothetical protein [Candidatus Methanomethylophilus sp. 1R26]KUE73647.1 hypothetical protein AUQ37_01725 [Candidatus Methanomethylophilus sp. 1R26]